MPHSLKALRLHEFGKEAPGAVAATGCNVHETHFLVNLDNHRTLGRCGETEVKYADVVSSSEGVTKMVMFSGGRDAIIEPPFMVLQNKNI